MNKIFFSLGLALLLFSIVSLFILIPSFSTPMHLPGNVSLAQPVTGCGGGCGGEPPFQISQSTLGSGLQVKYEWPKHVDINGSESISIALTLPPAPQSIFMPVATSTPMNPSDRNVEELNPNGLNTEIGARCASEGINDPDLCQISKIFGNDYKLSTASASMTATAFETQLMGSVDRSTDQPFIQWDWDIIPKSVGWQTIYVGINLQWVHIGKGGGTPIIRQLWESPLAIDVNKPFIDSGQLSLSALASGIFGTVFTGVSFPWLWEQRRQAQERSKKQSKYCRSCGAENSVGALFCQQCAGRWDSPADTKTSSSPPSSPAFDRPSSNDAIRVEETPTTISSEEQKEKASGHDGLLKG